MFTSVMDNILSVQIMLQLLLQTPFFFNPPSRV